VVASQANAMPFDFYLPNIDTQYEVPVVPGQTTVVTTPRVAGLTVTIPAGANLRNRDGSPVSRVSVTPVAIDRTPTPLPSNVTAALVYTIQPGGAISDIPMPVVYPNLNGLDPGTQMNLYKFNHDTVQWEIYGTGHVSADGRTVSPDTDPSTGQPFGLRDFSWYAASPPPLGAGVGGSTGNTGPCDSGCQCGETDKTVDMSTGIKIERVTDIEFGGARGGLQLTRVFNSAKALSLLPRAPDRFGLGWTHNFAIQLSGTFQVGGAGRLIMPDELSGWLFSYTGTDPSDGALLFTSTATVGHLGDVIRKLTDGTFRYRRKDGNVMRFDASGNLTALVDRNGNTTTLTYSGTLLTTVTDAVGRSITFTYDSLGKITSATDPLGRAWKYAYPISPIGFSMTVTDPLNNTMSYNYQLDSSTRPFLISVVDYRGNTAKSISYDPNTFRVTGEAYAGGGADSFSYTTSGTLVTSTTRTDPMGRVTTMRFDASGYVLESTDGLGQPTTIQRSIGPSLPLSVIGPCGCPQVTSTFDSSGNVLVRTDALGNTESFQYDSVFNNITRYTDKLGQITTFAHDSRGNLTSMTRAAGTLNLTTTFGYDSFGELTSQSDPLGHTTQFQYDASGNNTLSIDPLNNQTTSQYDTIGRLLSSTDPMGRTASMSYNALHPTAVTDQAGAITHFDADPNGNLVKVTDALQNQWTYTYDPRNNNTAFTDPLGHQSSYFFDVDDELIDVVFPSGRSTQYSYDSRGQNVSMVDPLGGVTSLTYDNRGNQVSLTDTRGNTTTLSYDQLFRIISGTDPTGNSSTLAYDAMDNIVQAVDRLSRHVRLNYDDVYRPISIAYSDATVTLLYDTASRPTEIDDTGGANIRWTYDDDDRILNESTAAGVVAYAYNAASQRISMTPAIRPTVSYGYDNAGRLQTISQASQTFTYSYDALSRRSSLQRPNGVTTNYSYDSAYRLARMTHMGSGGQPIEDLHYAYNLDDEITSITSLAPPLVLPQSATSRAADAANRIRQFGGSSYAFDLEGQMASKTDTTGSTNYQWDARGRLTQVTLPGNQTVSYSYDAIGRRSTRSGAGLTTTFLYDGLDVVFDKGSDGSAVDYVNGFQPDEKLFQNSGATPLYFLADHLGSTAALTDASGNTVEREQYEPYGGGQGSNLTRYTYTGREVDSSTGLGYYRSRWYDPVQSRFLTEDPIGISGGLNLYRYVEDNPIASTDPLGRQAARAARAPAPAPEPAPPSAPPAPVAPLAGAGAGAAAAEAAGGTGAAAGGTSVIVVGGLVVLAFAGGALLGYGGGKIRIRGKSVDDRVRDWMVDHIWKPDPGPASWPPTIAPTTAPKAEPKCDDDDVKKHCDEMLAKCRLTGLADKQGSTWKSSRCDECWDECMRSGGWPFSKGAPRTTGRVGCDFRKYRRVR
jgi:RHS repeat-associated protein